MATDPDPSRCDPFDWARKAQAQGRGLREQVAGTAEEVARVEAEQQRTAGPG
jgi:hypothetical protein